MVSMDMGKMLNPLFFLVILLFATQNVNALESKDSIAAQKQLEKAHDIYLKRDYDSALIEYQKTATIYQDFFSMEKQADIYNYLSGLSWQLRMLDDATSYCDTALLILDLNNADSLHLQRSKVYHNYGTIELLKGNLSGSVSYYEKAIYINEQAPNPMETSLNSNYANIGIAYSYLNNSQMALVYAHKALDLSLKYQSDDEYSIGQGYHNLGLAYIKSSEFEKAKTNLDKALFYYKKILKEPHFNIGQIYMNLGIIATSDSIFNKAIEYNNKAFYNFNEIGKTPHPESYKLLHNNASIYKMMGEYNKALECEGEIIEYWKEQGYEKHPYLANNYFYMGRIYNEMQEYDSALYYIQKGIIANIIDFNDTSIVATPNLDQILSKFYLGVSLVWKSDVLINKYDETGDTRFLKMAIDNYYLFSEVVDLSLQEFKDEEAMLTLYRDYIPEYENAIYFSQKAYNETKDTRFLYDAFFFSEKTNALVLNVALNSNSAIIYAGVSEAIVQKEENLNQDLLRFENDYNNIVTDLPVDSVLALSYLNDSIFDTKTEIEELNTMLEKDYPKYFQLKQNDNTISAKEIQNTKLSNENAIIEYYLSDTILYVITLTHNNIALDVITINSAFFTSINDFRKSTNNISFIQKSPYEAKNMYISSGTELYNKLFPVNCQNLIGDKSDLIIIPDGILNYLPFDALITAKPNTLNESYSNIKYLVNNYTINYAYSASMLNDNQDSDEKNAYYAGYAPIYDTSLLAHASELDAFEIFRSEPTALSGNITEVTNAGNILDGDTYIGNDAGERNFKESTLDYSIIHLAMHALINDKNPLSSTLIFTNTNDSVEDDYLHTYEIYSLKLNADLAVLSACNTADGLIHSGEGIMSLSRAFMYAGVNNLVSTLWTANDATSNLLMEHFFEKVQQGTPIASALRTSKINYIKSADPAHANPYYWANFILIGNNETVYRNNASFFSPYWIWIFSGLSIILLIFIWKKRREKKV